MKKKILLALSMFLLASSLVGCGSNEHNHRWSTTWSYDDNYHWHNCLDCSVVGYKSEHDFSSWVIDIEPTSSTEGHMHRNCSTCGYAQEDSIAPLKHIPANRVYVYSVNNEIFNGSTYQFSPVVFPYNATKNIKYKVEDSDVLTVSNDIAHAKKPGTTLVYVYNDEDDDDVLDESEAFAVSSFLVSNPDPDKSVTVESSVTIKVGETKKLNYSNNNISSIGTDYGFYSDDQSICTISAGVVKGHRAGTTRITVSLQGYKAYCQVNVIDNVDEVGLRASEIKAKSNILLEKGQSLLINYSILPTDSVDSLSNVTSNNSKVVRVNEDKSITAVSGGTARIKLETTNGKYTYVLVTVKSEPFNSNSNYYNNYYGDLTWENSSDLVNKLHNIISTGVTPLRYESPTNWESNQNADEYLYDHSYVDCVYTDNPILKTDTTSGWQREHAFAASLMTGYSTSSATDQLGRATDFHNLFASSSGANGSRNNKNLGYVIPESQELAHKDSCIYDRKNFEPADADKGRLARGILYMSVMYNQEATAQISESGKKVIYNQKPLEIVNDYIDYKKISLSEFISPSTVNKTIVDYYLSIAQIDNRSSDINSEELKLKAYQLYMEQSMPYAIGNLSHLVEWNSFPVDLVEMQHNNSVYSYNSTSGKGTQGNRNPFVDYPELVSYIYGELKDVPGSINELTPSYLTLEMDKDEIHHYAVESASLEAFESGSKPTIDDFNIKAIKNDLTEGILDKSKISVEDYTFTDEDVETGKVITITTDKNTLYVPCKVTSDNVITFDTCTWNHIDNNTEYHDKNCYGTFTNYVSTNALFSGLSFTVSLGNTTDSIVIGNSSSNGTKIGTGSSAKKPYIPHSVTFETNQAINFDGKNKINAIYFIASSASGLTYNYKFYIDDVVVGLGSFSGSNVEKNVLLTLGNELTGKVKIEFTNVEAAINIRGLAINAIA